MLDPNDELGVQHGQDALKGTFDLRADDREVFLEGSGPPQSILPVQSLPEAMSYLNQNQVLVQDQMEGENGGEQSGRKGPSWGGPQRTGAQILSILNDNCVQKTGLGAGLQDAVISTGGVHQHVHRGVVQQPGSSLDDSREKKLSGWVGVEEIDSEQTRILV